MFISEAHRNKLVKTLPTFLKHLNLSRYVMAHLGTNYTLISSMMDEIEAKPTRHEQISMLFQFLRQGTEEGFATFLEALVDTRQDDLANLLDVTIAQKLIRKRDDECTEKPGVQVLMPHGSVPTQPGAPSAAQRNAPSFVPHAVYPQRTEDITDAVVKVVHQPDNIELDEDPEAQQYKKEVGAGAIMEINFQKLTKEKYEKQVNDGYPMTHQTRGRVLIINNRYFTKLDSRHGTEHDEQNLRNLFGKLKFDVVVEPDKTVDQIRKLLDEEAKLDHSEYDAFILVILSHGSKGTIYGVDDTELAVDEITGYFDASKCRSLINKPKIFIIQACQGGMNSCASPFQPEAPESRPVPLHYQQVHDKADTVIAYSTIKGYMAWRHFEFGSCYIRSLVYVFKHYAHEKHFLDMLVKLNWLMSRWKDIKKEGKVVNLMAQSEQILTKGLFFFPGW